jgi:hypothetical protein
MQIQMHSRLMMVANFMQKNIETNELVPIAEALALIAPVIWGHYDSGSIIPLFIGDDPPTAIGQKQSISSEYVSLGE